MGSRLSLRTPADYVFRRDVCSYGYFVLAPNRWSPETETLERPLDLEEGVARLKITQVGGAGTTLRVVAHRRLSRVEQGQARVFLARMLRLDESASDVAAFHRCDRRWKRSGRGRLFRSPTFFEDVVKTITSCNVTWPSTRRMNERLCEVINPAFPRAGQIASRKPATLRARCGVGYRDARLVQLARMFRSGAVDEGWFEDSSRGDDEVRDALLALPGVGPYAAGNIMMLLGRYGHMAIDTETVRHARTTLGMEGTEREVHKKIAAHYEKFGEHRFRSYWCELWKWYESREGPSWTWSYDRSGTAFTASNLKKKSRG